MQMDYLLYFWTHSMLETIHSVMFLINLWHTQKC